MDIGLLEKLLGRPDSQKFLTMLHALEESLFSLQNAHTLSSDLSEEEAEILAAAADALRNDPAAESSRKLTDQLLAGNKKLAVALQQLLRSLDVMDLGEKKSVPEYLMKLIEYDYRTAVKKGERSQSVPGIIVNITAAGLQIIKSAFQGFTIREMGVSVRSSAALASARSSRIELEQTPASDADPVVVYNLIQESKDSLTLSISVQNSYGYSRIDLKQDGMITDSVQIQGENSSVNFSHLSPGFYEVDIRGSLNRSFGILIQGDL